MDDMRHVTFAEAVLLRPKMYTMGGSYEEVLAFLEGYYSGAARCPNGHLVAKRWWNFRDWLTAQLAFSSDASSGRGVFEFFQENLQADQNAIEELLNYLTRFEAEVPNEVEEHAP